MNSHRWEKYKAKIIIQNFLWTETCFHGQDVTCSVELARYLCYIYYLFSLHCFSPLVLCDQKWHWRHNQTLGASLYSNAVFMRHWLFQDDWAHWRKPSWKQLWRNSRLFSSHSLCMMGDAQQKVAGHSPSWWSQASKIPLIARLHARISGVSMQFPGPLLRSLTFSSLELGSPKEEELGVEVNSLWLSVTHESQGLLEVRGTISVKHQINMVGWPVVVNKQLVREVTVDDSGNYCLESSSRKLVKAIWSNIHYEPSVPLALSLGGLDGVLPSLWQLRSSSLFSPFRARNTCEDSGVYLWGCAVQLVATRHTWLPKAQAVASKNWDVLWV